MHGANTLRTSMAAPSAALTDQMVAVAATIWTALLSTSSADRADAFAAALGFAVTAGSSFCLNGAADSLASLCVARSFRTSPSDRSLVAEAKPEGTIQIVCQQMGQHCNGSAVAIESRVMASCQINVCSSRQTNRCNAN